jgi:hypothetical protein
MEKSRFDVAKQVIETLKSEQKRIDRTIENDLIVFDNGSTYPGSVEMLTSNFKASQIFRSSTNEGYWSALSWVFNNLKVIKHDWKKYNFVHVIESDHTYYALEKLVDCEMALKSFPGMGCVRMQEYSVKDKALYDKTLNLSNGRRYSWVSHISHVTGQPIECEKIASFHGPQFHEFYSSNFLSCLHSLNRISLVTDVFDVLSKREGFSENDFQKMIHDVYTNNLVLDGGTFHAKLGFTLDNPSVLSGSWSNDQKAKGYKTTRVDRILNYTSVEKL